MAPTIKLQVGVSLPRLRNDSIKQEVERYCERVLQFKIVKTSPQPHYNLYYEEKWFAVEYDVSVSNYTQPHVYFKQLCNNICNGKAKEEGEMYFTPSENCFDFSESGENTEDHLDVPLASFGLGAMIGSSTFYKHVLRSGFSANFEHHRRTLSLSWEGDCHYMMTLGYDEIIQIVVVVQSGDMFISYGSSRMKIIKAQFTDDVSSAKPDRETIWSRVSTIPGLPKNILGASSTMKLRMKPAVLYSIVTSLILKSDFKGFIHFSRVSVKEPTQYQPRYDFSNDFELVYAFFSLEMRGYYATDQMNDAFFRSVRTKIPENRSALLGSLNTLVQAIDDSKYISLFYGLNKLFEQECLKGAEEAVPTGCQRVRKMTITPTRILPNPPEISFENRILRTYGGEYALRVTFRDDNFEKLTSTNDDADKMIYEDAIIRPMKNGIQIGYRYYQFFAWSNSQLCDHGCWMYAQDPQGNAAAKMRENVGDLSELKYNLRCVATYMARLGQSFSHSKESVTIDVYGDDVTVARDIERGCDQNGKPFCFSDGIGRISPELMDRVLESVAPDENYRPCAFQVRYGGCKGMLAIDTSLQGQQMIIRDSMKKFESTHMAIEVVKLSHPIKLYLNRNVITILCQRGIDDSVFLCLQEEVLNKTADSLIQEESAIRSLKSKVQLGIDFDKVSKSGIYLTMEPFFKGMLNAIAKKTIGQLKRKARIELPSDQARNMFGVMDETGFLQEGEVFVQYSLDAHKPGAKREILNCEVMVTKNPAMHTGDMRKFKARKDIPNNSPLRSLYDVIVFPQNGRRPHPNEMAGSDLDGDEYFVTWMKELMFESPNTQPMDFTSPLKVKQPYPIKEEDMIRFLAEFVKNDRKGLLANAHLVHADHEDIDSSKCLSLARKYSEAVDFQKTGHCPKLDKEEFPKEYPDFMGKRDKKNYRSERALGELFRVCRSIEQVIPKDVSAEDKAEFIDQELVLEEYRHRIMIKEAKEASMVYYSHLQQIMTQYGIKNEFEAVSGCINGLVKRLQTREDTFDAERLAKLRVKMLWRKTREEFFEEFGGEQSWKNESEVSPNIIQSIILKAKAYYTACYCEEESNFVSFPWIVWDVLSLAKSTSHHEINVFSRDPKLLHIGQEIQNAVDFTSRRLAENELTGYNRAATLIRDNIREWRLLLPLATVLIKWGKRGKEKIIGNGRHQLTAQELILLVIDVGQQENILNGTENDHQLGKLLISFLKYCGSQQFAGSQEICVFSVPIPGGRHTHLHQRALQAYHYLAHTGQIDILLSDDGEFEEAIVHQYFRFPTNGTWKYFTAILYRKKWIDYLKKETGVERLNFLQGNVTGRPQGTIAASGTYDSLQKLAFILDTWFTTKRVRPIALDIDN